LSEQHTAIITGAASGIGRATAEAMARDGWRIVGIDASRGGVVGVELLTGDAGDASVLKAALDRCGGRLDALVCSAGVPPSGPWDDRAHWDDVLAVDLTAAFTALTACWGALVAAKGSAVLVGSIVGPLEGSRRSPGYAAAKAGIEGLARSFAALGGADGVRVNAVAPGPIDTGFDEPSLPRDARIDVALGRMRRPEEVAAVIRFLLGAEASYVTGAVWRVDGGRSVLSIPDALDG
jgi:NAD(P)-dependent dehydrogenase (short-subunit alcohol dehydrogenase family)